MITKNILVCEKWKDKYPVGWCNLCDCACILCESCENSSCGCSHCDKCSLDFGEFNKSNICVEDYLTEDEIKVVHKARRIQQFIVETLSSSEPQIDFQKLKEKGWLSKKDIEVFL